MLFIQFLHATELKIYPAKIIFNGSVNEEICNKIRIFTDYNDSIIAKTKWATKESRDINNYFLQEDYFELKLFFNKKLEIKNSKEEKICVTAKNPGNYHGALLYNAENRPVGVGIWIILNIQDEKNLSNFTGNSRMTGKVIKKDFEGLSYEKILYAIPTLILFGTFLFLLKNYKKKILKKSQ